MTKKEQLRYFYLNGKLHKLLRVQRARDEAFAWCYEEHAIRLYQWSDLQKRAVRGYKFGQAAKILNRTTRTLRYWIEKGYISEPDQVYCIENGKPGARIWSEDDIYKMREITANIHRGRPRSDGLITAHDAMAENELYAKLKHDITLYAKNKDGEFVPLYAAEDW
jgi:hypothetical protein